MVEHRAAHDRSGSGAPRHSSRANVVPAAVGPRLQTGDLLRISGGDFIVIALRKNKAAVRAFCRPGAREFTVTFEYALAMRKRAPRKLPNTAALLTALRSSNPITSAMVAAAAGENHLDAVDRQGQTALILAASRGELTAVRSLLRYDADVFAHGSDGEMALHKASAHNHAECVATLLAHAALANVDAPTIYDGCSALHLAAANGHTNVARCLLESGASVELCCRGYANGHAAAPRDALSLALSHGHFTTANVLAGYTTCGVTWAYARWSHQQHLRPLMLLGGCDPRITSAIGWLHTRSHWCTPLHCLEGMSTARARALLQAGADIHATSDDYRMTGGLPVVSTPAAADMGAASCAPSPLQIARTLLAQPTQTSSTTSREEEESGTAAARLVALASLPWCPDSHQTFPQPQRARAIALLVLGHMLGRAYGGRSSHALVEVWVDMIMPLVIRRPGCAREQTCVGHAAAVATTTRTAPESLRRAAGELLLS